MATKGDQIRNLVKVFGGNPRNSTIEDAIEDLVGLFEEKREVEMVEIVPEQSVTVNEYGNTNDVMPFSAKHNTKYTVEFDGVKTECVSWAHSDTVYIGNGNLPNLDETIGKGEDVPFCIECIYEQEWCVFYAEPNSTHTLAIYEEQETVTPPAVALPRVETKMVEILPEQSVMQTEIEGQILYFIKDGFTIETGKEYKAVVDGVNYDVIGIFESGIYTVDDTGNMSTASVCFICDPVGVAFPTPEGYGSVAMLRNGTANTRVAIYEEKEVVTPLDSKFTAPVVWYSSEDYLYHDKNYTLPVSEDDVKEYSTNDIAIITPNGYVFRPTCIKVKPSGCEIVSYDGDYSVRFYCYSAVS